MNVLRWFVLGLMAGLGSIAQTVEAITTNFEFASNPSELIAAIEAANDRPATHRTQITLTASFAFSEGVAGSQNALPVVRSRISILPETPVDTVITGGGSGSNFRFVEVAPGGTLSITGIRLTGFEVDGPGGAIWVHGGPDQDENAPVAIFQAFVLTLDDNRSSENGGALAAQGNARTTIFRSRFNNNEAVRGGAVEIDGRAVSVVNNVFENNHALSQDGSHVRVDIADNFSPLPRDRVFVSYNHFSVPPTNVGDNFVTAGAPVPIVLRYNSFANVQRASNAAAFTSRSGDLVGEPILFGGNAVSFNQPDNKISVSKVACLDFFGVGDFVSEGFNIIDDDSCPGDGPGDLNGVDPGFAEADQNGFIGLAQNSVAIDAGEAAVTEDGELPCGHRDFSGIARPQDGNGDGTAECDVGAAERVNGPNLRAAASAAYYDLNRNGEGIFVEMLSGGRALVYLFTYTPDGSAQAWMLGTGTVAGNSVVVDELFITSGASFGTAFDPTDVVTDLWGSLSFSLPTCRATGAPGVLSLTGNAELEYSAVISRINRLTTLVACNGSTHPMASRSGSYFNTGRSGEGIIVQILTDGRVVLQWFTYDLNNRQYWIQAVGELDGNEVVFDNAFTTIGPSYGPDYDPDDVVVIPWGTIRIQFTESGLMFEHESILNGFAADAYPMTRITTLLGTTP